MQPWLAQGSAPPPGVRVPFNAIVLAAREYQPELLSRYHVLHVPLDDSGPPSHDDCARIRSAAAYVAEHVRRRKPVLVTCWQGRNRSGVIAGLALRELGMSGREASRHIQLLRNGLTNPHFRAMVEG